MDEKQNLIVNIQEAQYFGCQLGYVAMLSCCHSEFLFLLLEFNSV